MKVGTLNAIEGLKFVDDAKRPHLQPCLVLGLSWFFLDRNCKDEADGTSVIDTHSGLGRWVIMTNQTSSLGALAAAELENAEAWDADLVMPEFEDVESFEDVEGVVELDGIVELDAKVDEEVEGAEVIARLEDTST